MEDSNNIKDSKHNYFFNKIKEKKKTLNNYIDYFGTYFIWSGTPLSSRR